MKVSLALTLGALALATLNWLSAVGGDISPIILIAAAGIAKAIEDK